MNLKNLFHLFLLLLMIFIPSKELSSFPPRSGCTMEGSYDSIKVSISSSRPMPKNLAVALNGEGVDKDECKSWGENFHYINFNKNRTLATIMFDGMTEGDKFSIYYEKGRQRPISSAIDLIFYYRGNCQDSYKEFGKYSNNNGIIWEPIYAYPKECGIDFYYGKAQVEL